MSVGYCTSSTNRFPEATCRRVDDLAARGWPMLPTTACLQVLSVKRVRTKDADGLRFKANPGFRWFLRIGLLKPGHRGTCRICHRSAGFALARLKATGRQSGL